jgi:uncharacterized membrane protein YeaQ/YmgE (transglycosylase-associated protein family)
MIDRSRRLGLLVVVVTGAITGWLGFRLAGYPSSGCLTNIVVGIGGGMLGGAVVTMLSGSDLLFDTGPIDWLIDIAAAVGGAALLVIGLKWVGRQG